MGQSATNVRAVIKRETTFGQAPTATGADVFRTLDSPGLKKSRANIQSRERRADQLENIGRLGGVNVTGSFDSEVNPGGDFDLLLEDLARGTIGALAENTEIDAGGVGVGTRVAPIITPTTAVYRSITVEQIDLDNDRSHLFHGNRVIGGDFNFQPGEMAEVTWNFQGVDDTVDDTPAASPYFTAPSITSGLPLIADDAVISYQGSPIVVCTGLTINVNTDAAIQPVIGSFVSPDVYMNQLRVSGEIAVTREDLAGLVDFDAETEFQIKIVMQAPGAAPRLTFAIIMRRCKILDIDAPFSGGDAAKIETRQFGSYPQAGQSNAIEFYTSTETPVIV